MARGYFLRLQSAFHATTDASMEERILSRHRTAGAAWRACRGCGDCVCGGDSVGYDPEGPLDEGQADLAIYEAMRR